MKTNQLENRFIYYKMHVLSNFWNSFSISCDFLNYLQSFYMQQVANESLDSELWLFLIILASYNDLLKSTALSTTENHRMTSRMLFSHYLVSQNRIQNFIQIYDLNKDIPIYTENRGSFNLLKNNKNPAKKNSKKTIQNTCSTTNFPKNPEPQIPSPPAHPHTCAAQDTSRRDPAAAGNPPV